MNKQSHQQYNNHSPREATQARKALHILLFHAARMYKHTHQLQQFWASSSLTVNVCTKEQFLFMPTGQGALWLKPGFETAGTV